MTKTRRARRKTPSLLYSLVSFDISYSQSIWFAAAAADAGLFRPRLFLLTHPLALIRRCQNTKNKKPNGFHCVLSRSTFCRARIWWIHLRDMLMIWRRVHVQPNTDLLARWKHFAAAIYGTIEDQFDLLAPMKSAVHDDVPSNRFCCSCTYIYIEIDSTLNDWRLHAARPMSSARLLDVDCRDGQPLERRLPLSASAIPAKLSFPSSLMRCDGRLYAMTATTAGLARLLLSADGHLDAVAV